ncbi:hypothetical protein JR316_0003776 [Psilocybe cubensis]|uniref:Uncharacterized protein n=2 Tax=Psilocybe cubensis TaxID=181762 RepID=A0ACB8HAW8_PSICU|nr:hypothetical protein JR316_0003776 [Psilocybe cubensis]KAH9484295.1 hypothetical protein JR316_0003776 [Psilocybe cubensis]
MASDQTARASLHPSRHGSIDIELKALKIHSRRLQSLLTIHATELQVLHRLYYKNKNQHRGALFWRNVTEMRRFLEKIEKLKLLDSTNSLRSTFYDTTQNINAIKGPWTHYPNERTLVKFLDHCNIAVKLLDKMSERSLIAYRSFHRSLQSAAFLQILLMFVAIASRAGTLATELIDTVRLIISCTNRLILITIHNKDELAGPGPIQNSDAKPQPMDVDNSVDLLSISQAIGVMTTQQKTAQSAPVISPTQDSNAAPPPITVPKTVVYKTRIEPKQLSEPVPIPKKKKRKAPRNEIDDIFGF